MDSTSRHTTSGVGPARACLLNMRPSPTSSQGTSLAIGVQGAWEEISATSAITGKRDVGLVVLAIACACVAIGGILWYFKRQLTTLGDGLATMLEEGVASGEIKFTNSGDVGLVCKIYERAFLTEMGGATAATAVERARRAGDGVRGGDGVGEQVRRSLLGLLLEHLVHQLERRDHLPWGRRVRGF